MSLKVLWKYTFVNEVAQGRNKTVDAVDSIAQGRVWTGSEALRIGLVDEIGTLDDALAYTAGLAGNPDLSAWGIVSYPKPLTPFERIFSQLGGKTGEEDHRNIQRHTCRACCQGGDEMGKKMDHRQRWRACSLRPYAILDLSPLGNLKLIRIRMRSCGLISEDFQGK